MGYRILADDSLFFPPDLQLALGSQERQRVVFRRYLAPGQATVLAVRPACGPGFVKKQQYVSPYVYGSAR